MSHATLDFETYSEAGFVWNEATKKWDKPQGATKKGIGAVGAAAYAEHPSTEVLTLSYELPTDGILKRWNPDLPPPIDLWIYLAGGGLVEAHNIMFERSIWHHCLTKRLGWPILPAEQLRCSQARARVHNLPPALGKLSEILPTTVKKDKEGTRLINKFSIPRNPTTKDPRTRIRFCEDPVDAENMALYCDIDVLSEKEVSALIPELTPDELEFWQYDQVMNWRGIGVDRASVRAMIKVLNQAHERYGKEFFEITGCTVSQNKELPNWFYANGLYMPDMTADTVEEKTEFLSRPENADKANWNVRRALEIKALIGSASVKKLFAIERMANTDDRLRNTIIHHGARTGRPTGEGAQPLNMPKNGAPLKWCAACNHPNNILAPNCRWCGDGWLASQKIKGWSFEAVEPTLQVMATGDLATVEFFIGDALKAISGCMRSMYVAAEGHDLIASDFSAIEAVVTAFLAGEEWRKEAFRKKMDIYLASAAKIEKVDIQTYIDYRAEHKEHHPSRQKIGKPAELGLGFGGWLGAWRQFDSSDTFTDDEVKDNIKAWRAASKTIPELWGGQFRGLPWRPETFYPELYGFEGCFINAIQNPSQVYSYAGISFHMEGDVLYITLLSGRRLAYHNPRVVPSTKKDYGLSILYFTYNTDAKKGGIGWVPMETYGGRIAENVIQATAHDILRYSILKLREAGYETVLHVYDEIVVEVPEGFGSIEEMESIMATMPPWCADWPVRASDGWRGKRYRKG